MTDRQSPPCAYITHVLNFIRYSTFYFVGWYYGSRTLVLDAYRYFIRVP